MSALNDIAVHLENIDLSYELVDLAEKQNLDVRRNATGMHKFDGCHRYVLLRQNVSTDISIRSRGCYAYEEARYSKWGMPSIIGEKRALTKLIAFLKQENKSW